MTRNIKRFFKNRQFYLLSFFIVFSSLLYVRFTVNHFTAGDEPHYLLMDLSLKNDGDFNLKNNYTNADYFKYYPEYIEPHVSYLNIQSPNSGWYSFHGIGLPLLIFPAFLISEKSGPAVSMVLVATLVVVLTFKWTLVITKHKIASIITAACLLACYFFNGLAGYLYPDLVIAALSLIAFIFLSSKFAYKKTFQFILAAIFGAMVFLHFRTIALVIPLATYFMLKYWKTYKQKLPWFFLGSALLMALVFFIYLYNWFGVWQPNKIYNPNIGVSIKNLINAPALLFDSLRGVITYNPILLILPVGIPLWIRYEKKTAQLLLLLLPILYVAFGFNEWHGGYAPNGRYLMGVLPILFPSIALFYLHAKSLLNRLFLAGLFAATLFITLVSIRVKQPYTGSALRSDIFIYIERHTNIAFDRFFPSYDTSSLFTDKFGFAQALSWTCLLLVLCVYGFVLAYGQNTDTGKRIIRGKYANTNDSH